MYVKFTSLHCPCHFSQIGEHHAFTLGIDAFASSVIKTENDILRRHNDWLAVSRREHIVRSQHQGTRFHLRFERQWNVNSHLVTVEVGVESRANKRVQLDGLALDQGRLKGLDTQTVKRRRTVEHDRMFTNNLFEDIPDYRLLRLDHLLGLLDGRCQPHDFKAIEDERLEQFKRHQFRQTALVQFELRTDDNDRAAGIVDTLTQQILTETAALTLDHICQ